MKINELQTRIANWRKRNFPNEDPHVALIIILEELGELAHAHAKFSQGVRINEDHQEQAEDAIGDIILSLLSYCDLVDLDAETCVMKALTEVESRNWIKYPNDGKTY